MSGPAPSNSPPTAVIGNPVVNGLQVTLNGNGSSDPDGDTLTYSWLFGDGQTSTAKNPSHTYGAGGTYTVSLTVSDGSLSDTANVNVTVSAPPPPPPPPPGSNGYYDMLKGRPDKLYAYTMRSQSQIDQYRLGTVPGSNPPTYDPDADAMKIVVGANKGSIDIKDQVHFPIDATQGSAYLLTWDTWFGPEFFTEAGGGWQTHKWVQIQVNEPGEDRWWEHRMRYQYASGLPEVARYDARKYGGTIGNNTDDQPIAPMKTNFMVHASVWTRHWMLIEPNGSNYQVTVWIADENRNAVMVFDHVDVEWPSTNLNSFEVEYNSSQERVGGPMTSYMRNLVMLKNPGDVSSLLVKPN